MPPNNSQSEKSVWPPKRFPPKSCRGWIKKNRYTYEQCISDLSYSHVLTEIGKDGTKAGWEFLNYFLTTTLFKENWILAPSLLHHLTTSAIFLKIKFADNYSVILWNKEHYLNQLWISIPLSKIDNRTENMPQWQRNICIFRSSYL